MKRFIRQELLESGNSTIDNLINGSMMPPTFFRSLRLMSLETEERHADDLGSSLELVVERGQEQAPPQGQL